MNIRQRLEIRALVNLIVSTLERLVNLVIKLMPKRSDNTVKPKPEVKPPHRPRPLKKVVDNINNIVPLPWRKNNE